MATKKVVELINDANRILNDVTKTRWPEAELLGWFNHAIRAIVEKRPDASPVNGVHACVAGTRQALPAAGLRLIDVVRNSTVGTAITPISRKILDEQLRDWHVTTTPSTDIRHFVYDDRNPKTFYLYPAPAVGHQVDFVYSTCPPDIEISNFATDVQVIPIDDIYANAIIDFMLWRCYSKDAEYAENANSAARHLQVFGVTVDGKTKADTAVSPNNKD